MTGMSYEISRTGVLLVDPYNDFLSEGGKTWPRLKEVAESVGLLDHLRAVVTAARDAGIRVFIVPQSDRPLHRQHHRLRAPHLTGPSPAHLPGLRG
jgi:nicotinamidase-related amidase